VIGGRQATCSARLDCVPALPNRDFTLPHVAPAIIPATDLGGLTVLKREGVFLLTGASGDVVPNSKGMGLYVGDTRVLSCLVLLVDEKRPVVLRPDPGGSARGTIVLMNPDSLADARTTRTRQRTLARRSVGMVRERSLDTGLHEQLALTNYADGTASFNVDVLLDADMADIFEVRGFVRP
jgi:glycogen debranching enzyme